MGRNNESNSETAINLINNGTLVALEKTIGEAEVDAIEVAKKATKEAADKAANDQTKAAAEVHNFTSNIKNRIVKKV